MAKTRLESHREMSEIFGEFSVKFSVKTPVNRPKFSVKFGHFFHRKEIFGEPRFVHRKITEKWGVSPKSSPKIKPVFIGARTVFHRKTTFTSPI